MEETSGGSDRYNYELEETPVYSDRYMNWKKTSVDSNRHMICEKHSVDSDRCTNWKNPLLTVVTGTEIGQKTLLRRAVKGTMELAQPMFAVCDRFF